MISPVILFLGGFYAFHHLSRRLRCLFSGFYAASRMICVCPDHQAVNLDNLAVDTRLKFLG